MTVQSLINQIYYQVINRTDTPFVNFVPKEHNQNNYLGWKYTIIGKSVDDALFLLSEIGYWLNMNGVAFKIGTKALIESGIEEQQYKLMTIYITNHFYHSLIFNYIKEKLENYKGHEGISLKYSEHIEGAIYKRVDMDENGYYIPANPLSNEFNKHELR